MSDPIPEIQSAYLNIRQAMSDAEYATEKFLLGERKEAVVWITAAIAQLEAARAKIEKETKRNDNRAVLNAVVGSFPDLPDCTDPFKERYIRDTEERACEAGSCKQNNESPKPKTDTTQPTAQPTVEPTVPGWYWVRGLSTPTRPVYINEHHIKMKMFMGFHAFADCEFAPCQMPEGWDQ